MSAEKILADWKKKQFKPVYWFEGEEDYFIDLLMHAAEHSILTPDEAGFNLTVFYGRDANWADIVNACKRYPMFAERQVVLLKEAQQMKDLDKLESYIEHPLGSTIFVVGHKEKKVDGRSKLAKLLKSHAVVVQTSKLKETELPAWTQQYIQQKGYQANQQAIQLLTEHIGNDLSRIANEIDKLVLNLGKRTSITEDDIEEYVGISKEYNVFELQKAVGLKQLGKAMQILQYFEGNPKAAPIQLVLPALYSHFSKTFAIASGADDQTLAQALGMNNAWALKDARASARVYGYDGAQAALLLLHHYNLRSVGVQDAGYEQSSLLKELICKLVMN